jgi:hypothetical protein
MKTQFTRITFAQMSVAALIAVIIATTPALFANSPPSTQGSGTNTAVTSCNLLSHFIARAVACSAPTSLDANNGVGCNFAFPSVVDGNRVVSVTTEIATATKLTKVIAGNASQNSAPADVITTNTAEHGGTSAIPALIVPSAAAVNLYNSTTLVGDSGGATARSGPSAGTTQFYRT